jgi:hypothetical protein
MIPDCTLTTACYDLTKYHEKSRNLEDGINNMRALLEVPCYLVIYTDKICFEMIKRIRDEYNLDNITHYVVCEFEELRFYKYNEIIKKNREKYWPTRDERTCSESHLVCCSKFDLVLNTIKSNPFNTKKFGWIDSNLRTNLSKICEDGNKHLLLDVLNNSRNDKFQIQILNVVDKKFKNEEHKYEYYQRYRWVVCGCLFITNEQLGIKILNRLNDIFEKTTNLGFGHGEEMLYLEVLDEFYDDIERSYGDYGQILNNFIYPTRNIHYIYWLIIKNYFNFGYHKECYDCCKKVLYSIENLNVNIGSDIYMDIMSNYYSSSLHVNPNESINIIKHIYFICNNNQNIKAEFIKNKESYENQFKLCADYNSDNFKDYLI